MTSQAQTAPSMRSKEDLSLVESCAWYVHVCIFPLFDLCEGSSSDGNFVFNNEFNFGTLNKNTNKTGRPPKFG